MLPKDPYILLSYVNTKLRDEFANLDELCAALDVDRSALEDTLQGVSVRYDEASHQFI